MPDITADQANDLLQAYIAADLAIATGKVQAYSIQGRSFTKLDVAEIREQIRFYRGVLADVSRNGGAGGIRVRRGVPL